MSYEIICSVFVYLLSVYGLIILPNRMSVRYPAPMIKLKSVTFRCSEIQQRRLEQELAAESMTRTELIMKALEQFLHFAESEEAQQLSLFELVEAIDQSGSGARFADEA